MQTLIFHRWRNSAAIIYFLHRAAIKVTDSLICCQNTLHVKDMMQVDLGREGRLDVWTPAGDKVQVQSLLVCHAARTATSAQTKSWFLSCSFKKTTYTVHVMAGCHCDYKKKKKICHSGLRDVVKWFFFFGRGPSHFQKCCSGSAVWFRWLQSRFYNQTFSVLPTGINSPHSCQSVLGPNSTLEAIKKRNAP